MTSMTSSVAIGIAFVYLYCQICQSIPVPTRVKSNNRDNEHTQRAKAHLHRFGYDFGRHKDEKEKFNMGLKRYQGFHGLPVTGRLDAKTKAKMKSPRCGIADMGSMITGEEGETNPAPRYKTLVSMTGNPHLRWTGGRVLPFYVSSSHKNVERRHLYYVTSLALQSWCSVTSLSFAPMFKVTETSAPEIEVTFSEGRHGCIVGVVFDGPGSVLAHAIWPYYYPPFRCDVHMDSAEDWDVGLHYHVDFRTNILWSLMHEFGHVLGVLHTSVSDDSLIMYPHQRLLVPQLGGDDVKAVQSMYGPRNESMRLQDDCGLLLPTELLEGIDAVMQGNLGEHYCFVGTSVYALYKEVSNDYIAFRLGAIQEVFSSAPTTVDAAEYNQTSGSVYLIKDDQVYEYNIQEASSTLDGKFYKFKGQSSLSDAFGYTGPTPINLLMTETVNGVEYIVFYKGTDVVWTQPTAARDVLTSIKTKYTEIAKLLGDMGITSAFRGTVYRSDGSLQPATYYLSPSGHYIREAGAVKAVRGAWWKIPDDISF